MSFENVKTFSNDSSLGKVACRAGDDVAKEKAADNAARFHDWPAKSLHEQDHDEHRESETNVLGTSPGKGMRSSDIWAFGEEIQTCIRDIAGARSITTSPVLKPVPIGDTPMSITVGPVTMGGKSFCRTFGGRNDLRQSNYQKFIDMDPKL